MAPWSPPRKVAWGNRETKDWSRPGPGPESWVQSPAPAPAPAAAPAPDRRRRSVAAPENRRLPQASCAQLPPIAPNRLPAPAPALAPGRRRHSLPCPGPGPGKENLPLLPENRRKIRRNSQGDGLAPGGTARVAARCPEKLQPAGGNKAKSEELSEEDCDSCSSADEEEFTTERIIDWLIGVNACLYRGARLGDWKDTLASLSEQDTSIKIVYQQD
ncbi:hypothetical protein chiPu_0013558 [Chiloscyllium punctatum]|uniref:Uncharacterized protein n=1 Tax=Chiloscyllium punctatum TaxID=137246 RepID=A0A401SXG5_CHIPU|nr:hypothetical protein [Chiloscyllium punctatum]